MRKLMSDLTILHVNDMHSNFHSIKTQTNFMRARRKELEIRIPDQEVRPKKRRPLSDQKGD